MNKEQMIDLVRKAYTLGFSLSTTDYNAETTVKIPNDDFNHWMQIDLEDIFETIGGNK